MTAARLALAALALAIGCGARDEERGRVIVLGLDGMEPSVVDRMIDEGTLPHFKTLRDDGASGCGAITDAGGWRRPRVLPGTIWPRSSTSTSSW